MLWMAADGGGMLQSLAWAGVCSTGLTRGGKGKGILPAGWLLLLLPERCWRGVQVGRWLSCRWSDAAGG